MLCVYVHTPVCACVRACEQFLPLILCVNIGSNFSKVFGNQSSTKWTNEVGDLVDNGAGHQA